MSLYTVTVVMYTVTAVMYTVTADLPSFQLPPPALCLQNVLLEITLLILNIPISKIGKLSLKWAFKKSIACVLVQNIYIWVHMPV